MKQIKLVNTEVALSKILNDLNTANEFRMPFIISQFSMIFVRKRPSLGRCPTQGVLHKVYQIKDITVVTSHRVNDIWGRGQHIF
jgi:hypothetical protein